MAAKRPLKFLFSLCISVGLLAYVISKVDFEQIRSAFLLLRWPLVILFWLIAVFALWLVALRFALILKGQDCPIGVSIIFRASFIASLYSFILPGGLSHGVKWYVLKKHSGKGAQVLASMFYNQLVTNMMTLAVGLIALMIENPLPEVPLSAIAAVILGLMVIFSVVLASPRCGTRVENWGLNTLVPKLSRISSGLGKGFAKLFTQLGMFRTVGVKFHLKILGMCLISRIVAIGAYVAAAHAANINVPISVIAWQCSAIYILALLPISLLNIGPREVTLVSTMKIYGVSAEYALALSALLFSVRLVQAVCGAVCQVFIPPGKNSRD